MANLRIIELKVINSTIIKASFTEKLTSFLIPDNILIESNIAGVPDPEVLMVEVDNEILTITTKPLTPFASYFVTLRSTQVSKFKSLNGQSFLLEDGQTNVFLILGAEDPDDPIRDNIIASLKDNIYNLDTNTLVRTVINSISKNLTKALNDIGQAKNDNYLQKIITDEPKVRGSGPYDRLNEEGAYEILRVGLTPTNKQLITSFSFSTFPFDPITLQRTDVSSEKLTIDSGIDIFNRLILTVKNSPVTKLTSVKFFYQNGNSAVYDISSFGYQVKTPKYDTDHASTLLTLNDNQFKLNEIILDSGFILPAAGDYVLINYEYKLLGRVIDENSIIVSQVLDAVREVVPPLFKNFALQHPIIVNANDTISSMGGVQFLDPNSNPPFSATHPAFIKELPFKLDGLPSRIGEYSVDYSTGRVFVYGATLNDGSGNYPPVASYKYRNVFSSRLDYTYNPDTLEIAANPSRNLPGLNAKITFNFENVLISGKDYQAQIHTEELAERIDNRLNASNSLSVKNSPITNVFRVFNETTGEIYVPTRWNDNKIFFSSNQAPRIFDVVRERASFINVLNETLIVNSELINLGSIRIFKCLLQNNNIISATEDVIGSSFNSSALFSRADIFSHEIFFDGQLLTETVNITRLSVGNYQIDYRNGIVYVGVSVTQNFDVGTVSYKKPIISPTNQHIIAVSEIYNSLNQLSGINKLINYISFADGQIIPASFDVSDERFLNTDTTLPYIFNAGTISVSDNVKDVRHIFDAYDLNNNNFPTDFAEDSTFIANIISLSITGIQKQETLTIQPGNKINVSNISPGIQIGNVISVIRVSDGAELYDNLATISVNTITLSGLGSPVSGQAVFVVYSVIMNGAATPIVDYNRGDYFVDYTYVADEIIVSYEYGDNVIDFRTGSNILSTGDKYYVSYKCGALRDALLKNFGSLVDISILNTFDITLSRENYRNSLMGALQSFTKGPTISAIKQIVSSITKIDPEVIESIFQSWSLGVSRLYSSPIKTSGNVVLFPAKFDNGVLIDLPDQTISFPAATNLRLEQGTLETWIIPEWDGLDNDATLSFSNLTKDGYALDIFNIYIGASSFNPSNVIFNLNRKDEPSPIGLPSAVFTKQNGLFVYYDDVVKRWKILAKDRTSDGYIYSGTILSSGEVYDVKFLPGLGEIDDVLRSFTNKIDFEFHIDGYDVGSPDGYTDGYSSVDGYFPKDGYVPGYSFDGITFMADDEHYIFDFAEEQAKNRFSIYKDGRGYLNFQVFDRGNKKRKNSYKVSADISNWKAGQKYHIATSWKLNSSNRQDEMHLFVNGLEVSNILRYGGRPIASSTDRFRTVSPEIIAGSLLLNTLVGNDLVTTAGSNVVRAGINFATYGIVAGNQIEIREIGFGTYTILSVSATSLTLSSTMPTSLNNARFSVNPFSVIVASEIDLYSNISVSILHAGLETEIPGQKAVVPGYEISKNIFNQNVLTLLGNAQAGDKILIRTLGLNHRRARDRVFIWDNTTSVLKSRLPPPINLDQVKIVAVLLPAMYIGPSNSIFGGGVFTATGITTSQPSSATEGRTLAIRVIGTNTNFSTPVSITIHGTTVAGPLFEILTFSSATSKNTINKFKTISSIDIVAKPFDSTKNSAGLEIREAYSITNPEGNNIFPVIRFSYKVASNSGLVGTSGSNILSDSETSFLESMVGNLLVINSPGPVAGTYTITARIDEHTISVNTNLAATFSSGNYDVFNITLGRSGFQNGFFYLETAGSSNVPYLLKKGLFEFDYPTYLEIPFDPINDLTAFVGSDFNGKKQAKAVIDEFRILSKKLTDTRTGETIADTDHSITTDFHSSHSFRPDSNTLTLLHFDTFPIVNSADFWTSSDRAFRQSASSVNSNFNQSLLITDAPLIVDNRGLISNNEGSIEFWVSPQFDTYNDPNFRFYFDASGSVLESVVSSSNGIVKLNGKASKIISVRLATDTFNDGVEYFAGGKIKADQQTILLNKILPSQQTPVKINYIPNGLSGDRISIYKDQVGFITFNIRARGIDYQLRQPAFWQRDSWHRVRATFKLNRRDHKDELRLFVDGEEKGTILFGSGLLFGNQIVFGQAAADANQTLISDINFTDNINQFYIGSDYFGVNTARARIDNLRLSNVARSAISIGGQPKDVNFSSNTNIVFPVVPDAFTTYLLDFDTLIKKNDDFALLKNQKFGVFDFTLNITDSFDIVSNNAKLKQILETLIKALKPAQSKTTINYIK